MKSNPLVWSPNKLPHFDSVSKFVAFNVIYEPRKESLNVGEHDSTRTEQSHNQAWESNSDTKLENSLVVEVKGESALNGYPLKQNQGRVPKPWPGEEVKGESALNWKREREFEHVSNQRLGE